MLKQTGGQPVPLPVTNEGRKDIARAEAHLVYGTKRSDSTRVGFLWRDVDGEHADFRKFASYPVAEKDLPGAVWKLPTGKGTVTKWVSLESIEEDWPD